MKGELLFQSLYFNVITVDLFDQHIFLVVLLADTTGKAIAEVVELALLAGIQLTVLPKLSTHLVNLLIQSFNLHFIVLLHIIEMARIGIAILQILNLDIIESSARFRNLIDLHTRIHIHLRIRVRSYL